MSSGNIEQMIQKLYCGEKGISTLYNAIGARKIVKDPVNIESIVVGQFPFTVGVNDFTMENWFFCNNSGNWASTEGTMTEWNFDSSLVGVSGVLIIAWDDDWAGLGAWGLDIATLRYNWNGWHYLVGVFDRSGLATFYHQGEPVATHNIAAAAAAALDVSPSIIHTTNAAIEPWAPAPFAGPLALHTTLLSAAQIREHYYQGTVGWDLPETEYAFFPEDVIFTAPYTRRINADANFTSLDQYVVNLSGETAPAAGLDTGITRSLRVDDLLNVQVNVDGGLRFVEMMLPDRGPDRRHGYIALDTAPDYHAMRLIQVDSRKVTEGGKSL